jgi:hypothetical protein
MIFEQELDSTLPYQQGGRVTMKKVSLYLLILTVLIGVLSGIIWAGESAAPVADGTATTSTITGTTWSLSETVKNRPDPGYTSLSGLAVPEYHRGPGGPHRRGPRGYHESGASFDERFGFVMLVTALAIIVAFGSDTYYD